CVKRLEVPCGSNLIMENEQRFVMGTFELSNVDDLVMATFCAMQCLT
ncbi:20139_t:CDS:1, partial [Gigaspora rosea]